MRGIKLHLFFAASLLFVTGIFAVTILHQHGKGEVTARVSSLHLIRVYLLKELEISGRPPLGLIDLLDQSGRPILESIHSINRSALLYFPANVKSGNGGDGAWVKYTDKTGVYILDKTGIRHQGETDNP